MTDHEYNPGVEGLTTVQSDFGPKETMDRLEADVRDQGMRVFARINHTALAVEAGLVLQPTELLIFGNPSAGTPLMQANQTMGIDLPLKVLVWQDTASRTWLTYNEPELLAKRHGVENGSERVISSMSLALVALAKKATERAWTSD